MDVTLVRIVWLVIALLTGVGFIAYIVAWIAMPYGDLVIMPANQRFTTAQLVGALAAMVLPVYAFVRWVIVFDSTRPYQEVIAVYLAGFPPGLRSTNGETIGSIVGCLVAALLAMVARRSLEGIPASVATALFALALLLGAWNLFTMM